MGNTSSAKNRHASGDDTAPTLTATGRYDSSAPSFMAEQEMYQEPAIYKRARASTLTPGTPVTQQMTPRLLPTVFKWEGGGKEVLLSGSFNGWKTKIPLVKSHGDFYTIVDLPEGEHEYKFLVDGQWTLAPGEPTTPNGMGSQNNKILVKKSDFEVFEALALDSRATNKSKKHQDGTTYSNEYGQDIPPRRTEGKQPGPPFLPPQLLQVILNKDTPAHCEPSLLPEPNHVMLNHLYALSIKTRKSFGILGGQHNAKIKQTLETIQTKCLKIFWTSTATSKEIHMRQLHKYGSHNPLKKMEIW
ncbi:5'-AMP-activated protein kinase subunit beta-2-like isoform X2 [Pomacea canaliculata]|uniref:5'-AMP-activated protein kinase subunit beta-2-like isoform X2 n=1 Tax=Pomacea canaliculata TaxID=400727 RepID=UPI000D737529|nr:5'-AMP-activated protein kinase subunit beta-2-like isoform X2 [Pomacea canaliculata]